MFNNYVGSNSEYLKMKKLLCLMLKHNYMCEKVILDTRTSSILYRIQLAPERFLYRITLGLLWDYGEWKHHQQAQQFYPPQAIILRLGSKLMRLI